MKTLVVLGLIFSAPFAHALTTCDAIKMVETRTAVVAAAYLTHLTCPTVLTPDEVNAFGEANKVKIKQAINVAVAAYTRRDGSRKKYDELNTQVANNVNQLHTAQFCDQMAAFAPSLQTQTIEQLAATQTTFPLPDCEF